MRCSSGGLGLSPVGLSWDWVGLGAQYLSSHLDWHYSHQEDKLGSIPSPALCVAWLRNGQRSSSAHKLNPHGAFALWHMLVHAALANSGYSPLLSAPFASRAFKAFRGSYCPPLPCRQNHDISTALLSSWPHVLIAHKAVCEMRPGHVS